MLTPTELTTLHTQLQEIHQLLPELETLNKTLLEITGNTYTLTHTPQSHTSPIETAYLQLQHRLNLVNETQNIVNQWGYPNDTPTPWTIWVYSNLEKINQEGLIQPWHPIIITTLHTLLKKLFTHKHANRSLEETTRILEIAATYTNTHVSREDLHSILGVPRERIRQWIHRGKITETKNGIPTSQAWELLQKINQRKSKVARKG